MGFLLAAAPRRGAAAAAGRGLAWNAGIQAFRAAVGGSGQAARRWRWPGMQALAPAAAGGSPAAPALAAGSPGAGAHRRWRPAAGYLPGNPDRLR